MLRALRRLLDQGLPVKGLKKALNAHRRIYSRIAQSGEMKRFLLTNGRELIFAEGVDRLVDLTNDGQILFAFVVDMDHARSDVAARSFEVA